jgi:hypothetical protein
MQRKLSSVLVLAAAIAAPTAVLAAGTEPSARPPSASSGSAPSGNPGASMTFNSLDTNRDGHVSRDEVKNSSQLSKNFSQLDKNNDGKLSSDELAGAPSSPAPASSPLGAASSR